jgi:hypothetical protein
MISFGSTGATQSLNGLSVDFACFKLLTVAGGLRYRSGWFTTWLWRDDRRHLQRAKLKKLKAAMRPPSAGLPSARAGGHRFKKRDVALRSGRKKAWLKSKCFTESHFVLVSVDKDRKTGAPRALLATANSGRLEYASAAFIKLAAEVGTR